MKFCQIYDDDYPWDVRIEKVGRALVEAGHQVCLATRNRKRAPLQEQVDTMDVWRMPPLPLLPAKLDVKLMFPAFFSPRWIAHIGRVAASNDVDALIVRDLPLAPTAIMIGQVLRRPVVLDMAENYPAALRAIHEHKTPTVGDHLARNPLLAQFVEDACLPWLDHTLVVCEENRQRLLDKGASPDKVTVIGNTPNLDTFVLKEDVVHEARRRFEGAFVLVYVGAIDPFRGLDTIIEALPTIGQAIPNIRLAILGQGQGQGQVEAHARRLGVLEMVDFIGFRPLADLPAFISSGDVGVIPHHRNDHIDTTLPNKLFDYMALGRPVLSTDARPLRRIIESEGSGLVYRSGDAADFAAKVVVLHDGGRRAEMGSKGRASVERRYNWGRDAQLLVDACEALQGGH
jgi:glycosyltransferase involved in cell wall biosynthesis